VVWSTLLDDVVRITCVDYSDDPGRFDRLTIGPESLDVARDALRQAQDHSVEGVMSLPNEFEGCGERRPSTRFACSGLSPELVEGRRRTTRPKAAAKG